MREGQPEHIAIHRGGSLGGNDAGRLGDLAEGYVDLRGADLGEGERPHGEPFARM